MTDASNPFDQFDGTPGAPPVAMAPQQGANPFDQFDGVPAPIPVALTGQATGVAQDPGATGRLVGAAANAVAPVVSLVAPAAAGAPGLIRGAQDVGDTMARGVDIVSQYVDDRVPALASLDQAAGQEPAKNVAALDRDRAAYEQQYGSDPVQQVARVVGQVATSAPILGAAGEVAAGAGRVLGAAVPGVAPVVQGVGNALASPSVGGLAARTIAQATQGAAQGAGTAALTSSQSDDPISSQMVRGAEMGAIAQPVAGVVASGLGKLGNMAIGAGGVSPERAALAQLARDKYGIPITAPQISDSPMLTYADSQSQKLPFSGAGQAATAQHEAFTSAVANDMGETATRLTPPVMDAAKTRIGAVFDSIAHAAPVHADQTFLNDLARIETDAPQTLAASEVAPIRAQMQNILDKVQPGDIIGGDAYQALTRRGAPLDRAMNSADPNIRFYASQVRDALDDALQRSLPPNSPLMGQLQQARQQWRTMRTIEPLVEKSTDGLISAPLLMGAVRSAPGSIAYGNGGGNLGDLARIGQAFFKAPPDSGTATRVLIDKAMTGVAAGAGDAVIGHFSPMAAAGAALGGGALLLGNNALGGYMRGAPLANRLINIGVGAPVPANALAEIAPYAGQVGAAVDGRVRARDGSPQNALATVR